jgi:hypothetical protein
MMSIAKMTTKNIAKNRPFVKSGRKALKCTGTLSPIEVASLK